MMRRFGFVAILVFWTSPVAAGGQVVPEGPDPELFATEKPAYAHRMVWMWEEMDKNLLHIAGKTSFFSRKDMLEPDKVDRYVRYAEFLQRLRINELCISVSFNSHNFMDILPQLRAMSEFLDGYGIDMYLHVPYGHDARKGGPQDHPNCPFDEGFAKYWNELADKLFGEVPLLKGYVMKGTGFEGIPGPLSDREGACAGQSDEALMLKAFEILADSVGQYGGTIFYRTWTTGALQDREYKLFKDLAGKTPSNLIVVSKKGYGDFGIREFPHPLFGHVHPQSPHVAEFQIIGEYRGLHRNPCQMVDVWGDWLSAHGDQIDGLMGIAEVDRETFDHPFNMVNWYAFGVYGWRPTADPEAIFRDWAVDFYGEQAAPVAMKVARMTELATQKLMYFKGVWIQLHSLLPNRTYLDPHLRGPWVYMKHDPDKIGWGRPLDIFPPEVAAEYAKEKDMQLFLNRSLITPELLATLSDHQRQAVSIYEKMLALWEAHRGTIPDAHYEEVRQDLAGLLADARLWALNTEVYIHWLQEKDYADLLSQMEEINDQGQVKLSRARSKNIIADWRKQLQQRKEQAKK